MLITVHRRGRSHQCVQHNGKCIVKSLSHPLSSLFLLSFCDNNVPITFLRWQAEQRRRPPVPQLSSTFSCYNLVYETSNVFYFRPSLSRKTSPFLFLPFLLSPPPFSFLLLSKKSSLLLSSRHHRSGTRRSAGYCASRSTSTRSDVDATKWRSALSSTPLAPNWFVNYEIGVNVSYYSTLNSLLLLYTFVYMPYLCMFVSLPL